MKTQTLPKIPSNSFNPGSMPSFKAPVHTQSSDYRLLLDPLGWAVMYGVIAHLWFNFSTVEDVIVNGQVIHVTNQGLAYGKYLFAFVWAIAVGYTIRSYAPKRKR